MFRASLPSLRPSKRGSIQLLLTEKRRRDSLRRKRLRAQCSRAWLLLRRLFQEAPRFAPLHGNAARDSLWRPREKRCPGLRPSWGLRALAILLLPPPPPPPPQAQAYIPTPRELDELLAPVALYPDSLLAQITSASTNPQEILDVDDWLHRNPDLNGIALTNAAQEQGFDPSFLALVNFPQILDMMAQNIDDYAAVGAAFRADQGLVMDSVQRLRHVAYGAGTLRSGPQQRVVVESYNGQQIILIQPANPTVVYVPEYNPYVVYGYGGLGMGSWITFSTGIGLGVALANSYPWGWGNWGWNWIQRRLIYNQLYWRPYFNYYRPPRPIYRPGRPNFGSRPPILPPRSFPSRRAPFPPARPPRPGFGNPPVLPSVPRDGVRRAPIPTHPRPTQPTHPRPIQPTRPRPPSSNAAPHARHP